MIATSERLEKETDVLLNAMNLKIKELEKKSQELTKKYKKSHLQYEKEFEEITNQIMDVYKEYNQNYGEDWDPDETNERYSIYAETI